MSEIILHSAGVYGRIIAETSKIEEIIHNQFTYHYIPECKISLEDNYDITLSESSLLEEPAIINFPNAILKDFCDAKDYVVVCEYLMERARQEKYGICSISSSSVANKEKGILFFGGATNLGKSSCALELAANGFEMICDEKTLIDLKNKRIYGGCKGIPLRKEVIRQRFNSDEEFKIIDNKSVNKPELSLIILPHIDHGLKEPIYYQFNEMDLFWHLTNEFSRRIRGNTKFINKFKYLLPSIDTEKLAQERVTLTKELASHVKAYYFQGSLSQMKTLVKKELEV